MTYQLYNDARATPVLLLGDSITISLSPLNRNLINCMLHAMLGSSKIKILAQWLLLKLWFDYAHSRRWHFRVFGRSCQGMDDKHAACLLPGVFVQSSQWSCCVFMSLGADDFTHEWTIYIVAVNTCGLLECSISTTGIALTVSVLQTNDHHWVDSKRVPVWQSFPLTVYKSPNLLAFAAICRLFDDMPHCYSGIEFCCKCHVLILPLCFVSEQVTERNQNMCLL